MRADVSRLLILAVLVTACAAQPADDLPLTVVALQGAPQAPAAQPALEWSPPSKLPTLEGTLSPADIALATVTPGPTVVVPAAVPSRPALVLPVFALSADDLVLLNGVVISDVLQMDTAELVLIENTAAPLRLIPDSELVYGPAYADFDTEAFVERYDGRLKSYREKVDDRTLTGAQVVDYVARQYSVGPRVLLALLEHSGGWITQPARDWVTTDFPMGYVDPNWRGLQAQLTWTANRLNYGYYGRRWRGLGTVYFADNTYVVVDDELNAGTVAVQMVLGLTSSFDIWKRNVGPGGFLATYRQLFGDPADHDLGPTLPADLAQPSLELPWREGETWYYSGGPHGGWAGGSAWAAVDFVPPGDQSGCYDTDAWARAVAPGIVVRSQFGMVVLDLDEDGLEQTGWVINYAHIAGRERVYAGMRLDLGEIIGHPSCEGGVSTGTHIHLTRRYNGEWVSAGSGTLPMVLSGWTVGAADYAYDGTMVKGGAVRTAIAGRASGSNELQR